MLVTGTMKARAIALSVLLALEITLCDTHDSSPPNRDRKNSNDVRQGLETAISGLTKELDSLHQGLTFQGSELILHGKSFRLLSGAIHYFRVFPEHWRDRLMKLRAAGLNTVETYVPWNLHEPERGRFDMEGRLDLDAFLRAAADAGLHAIVRPGPYICAEWDMGGLPAWLLSPDWAGLRRPGDPPGAAMRLRSTHPAFLRAVAAYFDRIIPVIARHQAAAGGPVIAVQIENEYGSYADNDPDYLGRLRDMMAARGLDPAATLFFTSDGASQSMLSRGAVLPPTPPPQPRAAGSGSGGAKDALAAAAAAAAAAGLPPLMTVNFESQAGDKFEELRRFVRQRPALQRGAQQPASPEAPTAAADDDDADDDDDDDDDDDATPSRRLQQVPSARGGASAAGGAGGAGGVGDADGGGSGGAGYPLVVMEFWCGWFDHWGEVHHTREVSDVVDVLGSILAAGGHANLYMFHGGTNFGFTAGANHEGRYRPTITSYDYHAPLDEAGRPTAKYHAIQRLLTAFAAATADGGIFSAADAEPARLAGMAAGVADPPAAPAPAPAPGPAIMSESLDVLRASGTIAHGPFRAAAGGAPHCMECFPMPGGGGQAFGFVLYRATLPPGAARAALRGLHFGEVRDRAQVFVDGVSVDVLTRGDDNTSTCQPWCLPCIAAAAADSSVGVTPGQNDNDPFGGGGPTRCAVIPPPVTGGAAAEAFDDDWELDSPKASERNAAKGGSGGKSGAGVVIEILVENMGRVNFQRNETNGRLLDRKGILRPVLALFARSGSGAEAEGGKSLEVVQVEGWDAFPLEFDEWALAQARAIDDHWRPLPSQRITAQPAADAKTSVGAGPGRALLAAGRKGGRVADSKPAINEKETRLDGGNRVARDRLAEEGVEWQGEDDPGARWSRKSNLPVDGEEDEPPAISDSRDMARSPEKLSKAATDSGAVAPGKIGMVEGAAALRASLKASRKSLPVGDGAGVVPSLTAGGEPSSSAAVSKQQEGRELEGLGPSEFDAVMDKSNEAEKLTNQRQRLMDDPTSRINALEAATQARKEANNREHPPRSNPVVVDDNHAPVKRKVSVDTGGDSPRSSQTDRRDATADHDDALDDDDVSTSGGPQVVQAEVGNRKDIASIRKVTIDAKEGSPEDKGRVLPALVSDGRDPTDGKKKQTQLERKALFDEESPQGFVQPVRTVATDRTAATDENSINNMDSLHAKPQRMPPVAADRNRANDDEADFIDEAEDSRTRAAQVVGRTDSSRKRVAAVDPTDPSDDDQDGVQEEDSSLRAGQAAQQLTTVGKHGGTQRKPSALTHNKHSPVDRMASMDKHEDSSRGSSQQVQTAKADDEEADEEDALDEQEMVAKPSRDVAGEGRQSIHQETVPPDDEEDDSPLGDAQQKVVIRKEKRTQREDAIHNNKAVEEGLMRGDTQEARPAAGRRGALNEADAGIQVNEGDDSDDAAADDDEDEETSQGGARQARAAAAAARQGGVAAMDRADLPAPAGGGVQGTAPRRDQGNTAAGRLHSADAARTADAEAQTRVAAGPPKPLTDPAAAAAFAAAAAAASPPSAASGPARPAAAASSGAEAAAAVAAAGAAAAAAAAAAEGRPVLVRGWLTVGLRPDDTWLDMSRHGWRKGIVFINGFNLGRYWERGPQRTLYVPGPVLMPGRNEILVLELHYAPPGPADGAKYHRVETVDGPLHGPVQVYDSRLRHRKPPPAAAPTTTTSAAPTPA